MLTLAGDVSFPHVTIRALADSGGGIAGFSWGDGTNTGGLRWNSFASRHELFTEGVNRPIEIATHDGAGVTTSGDISILPGDTANAEPGKILLKPGTNATTGLQGAVDVEANRTTYKFDTNDGSQKFKFTDSDDVEIASVDSDGDLSANNVNSANISATETSPGTSEIATQAETDAGTDDTRIITSLKLAARKGPQLAKRTGVADANYNALATDYLIAYTSITAARTVNLPDPATVPNLILVIKDESGAVTAVNKITLTPAAGNIDGAASLDIVSAYGAKEVYSNGSNWFTK
jgi:hypothetical protein